VESTLELEGQSVEDIQPILERRLTSSINPKDYETRQDIERAARVTSERVLARL